MAILIKEVRPDDLTYSQVRELQSLRLKEPGRTSIMTRWLMDPDSSSHVVLALDGSHAVGWGLRSTHKAFLGRKKYMLSVFVKSDYRRKGIGSALFEVLNFEARGLPLWVGYHNEASTSFWTSMLGRFWPTDDGWGHPI